MPNDPKPSPIPDPQVKAVLARLQAGRKRHASGGHLAIPTLAEIRFNMLSMVSQLCPSRVISSICCAEGCAHNVWQNSRLPLACRQSILRRPSGTMAGAR